MGEQFGFVEDHLGSGFQPRIFQLGGGLYSRLQKPVQEARQEQGVQVDTLCPVVLKASLL